MRIGLVSTCALTTPPKKYGGTELMVAELAHGLTELGEDVVVYATGDSRPHGRLRALEPAAVWPPSAEAAERHHRFALGELARSSVEVVHLNDYAALPHVEGLRAPSVLTIHHERETSMLGGYARTSAALVAISERQAELSPELPFAAVIHHGVDPARYPAGDGAGGYAAFLGRFAPEKGPHHAIDAAVAAKVPIRLAGCAHEVARAYFDEQVATRMQRHERYVDWPGELGHVKKVALLRDAVALLMPIDWEEPFGLVMIEAMMVGTPVLAFARGSVPEVVDEGVTGFIVGGVGEMAERLRSLGAPDAGDAFDRKRCRERAVERFSYRRMANDYLELYQRLAAEGERHARTA